jgi:hypothetical protein
MIYTPSRFLHFLGPCLAIFFIYLGIRIYFENIDPSIWVYFKPIFSSACITLSGLVLILYIKTAFNKYELTDDGIIIHRPIGNIEVQYKNIHNLTYYNSIRTLICKDTEGKTVFFTSSDAFPEFWEFYMHLRDKVWPNQSLKPSP